MRFSYLYDKLSAYFDVTLLAPTYPDHQFGIVTRSETFREYRIPKEDSIHDRLHHKLARDGVGPEVSALICALSAAYPNDYHRYYFELYKKADVIVHDSPYMLEYDLFWGIDGKPRIYNSYNVEYLLMKQLFDGKNADTYLRHIFNLEKRAVLEADKVFAISEDEKNTFVELYGVRPEKITLAPNGIDPEIMSFAEGRGKKSALFIGSQHPPNIEAVDFIVKKVASRCPEIDFLIAGSCCAPFMRKLLTKNVHLLGKVDEARKKTLLATAAIALNPMFAGAGTNLKTLEYLSCGMPLISTDVGVRGLTLKEGEHFVMARKDNFADRLMELIGDDELRGKIARAGRDYVTENYSWEKIAGTVRDEIDCLPGLRRKSRKLILLLNDFSASRPSGGGEVRINRLYGALSRYHDMVLLCLNDSSRITRSHITRTFTEISFPKTPGHAAEEKRVHDAFWVSASDIVSSYMCAGNPFFLGALRCFYDMADLVVLIHPYMLPALKDLGGKPLIYESLNFESGLKRNMLRDHPLSESLIRQVESVERDACKQSSLVISVSQEDIRQLVRFCSIEGLKAFVVRNGVDVKDEDFFQDAFSEVKNLLRGRQSVLFVGSGHRPNITALEFIADHLAPVLPHCIFFIIGTVCDAFQRRPVPKNILLFGKLDAAYKEVLLRIADAAINPMIEGSGSNLKLAEYLAYRLPTVTTEMGARGYDVEDGKEVVICELHEFAGKIGHLLGDDAFRHMLSGHGYAYALGKLDWNILADEYFSILDNTVFKEEKKKLLALTYRFTNPPLGGAEVYLLNVLREIDRRGDFSVTVATLDIMDIFNKYHFSTEYTFDGAIPALPDMPHTSVYKFRCKRISDDVKLKNARLLFRRWMEEFVLSSLRHVDKFSSPLLMGGWNFPERANGRCEIWSSDTAFVFVAGAEEIEIEGYSPHGKELSISSEEESLYTGATKGNFRIAAKTAGSRWVKLEIDAFTADSDPRRLGVRIYRIKCRMDAQWHDLNLNYNYRDYLKERYLEEYIEELIRTAESRPSEYDDLFQYVRGPVSPELENWLDRNINKFDVVLGHSIPFSTSVLAATYAKKYGKPLLILPHFHMDDEFYHWKSYYEALREATAVLASPLRSIDLFFSKIAAKAVYLSGGIDLQEHKNVDTSHFTNVYADKLPFFLVLGRKAGSKNYKWVIDAFRDVNKNGKLCNLVIIGKDEDGERIDARDAMYLAEQPRDVVLGALKECVGLVNMSESESFGIVILEAWMHKKPVIVNGNCGAFAELVEDGSDGLLAGKGTLQEKIAALMNDEGLARLLGERGHAKVLANFSWEAVGRKANGMLKDLVPSDYSDIHKPDRQT